MQVMAAPLGVPMEGERQPLPFFYSYDYGAAHIISLSNYVYVSPLA